MKMRRTLGGLLMLALSGCGSCRCAGQGSEGSAGEGGAAEGTKAPPQVTASWTAEPTTDGVAVVRFNHATAIEYSYGFFGADWQWGGAKVTPGSLGADGAVTFDVVAERLGLSIAGTMRAVDDRTLEVSWAITAEKAIQGIEGGGLDFRLRPNPTLVKRGAKKPELLPGNRGYRWPVGDGEAIEVTFEGEMSRVYFNKGQAQSIRAFFVGSDVVPGTRTVTMRITLPESGRVQQSLAQRYGAVDDSWRPQVMRWDTTPVDLSHLNEPMGKHGAVTVDGDALVFADGTPARFWGANVVAGALFLTEPDVVKAQAKRLAAFGFNLVRIHHHDAYWMPRNVIDPQGGLHAERLAKIDWWVKCLQDEGIYVWIDLHVGRAFNENDSIRAFGELAPHRNQGRGFNYVNPSVETAMADFAKAYFDRKNAHTGVRYVDDPGVIGVLVTNENDLTYHGVRYFAHGSPAKKHIGMFRRAATPIIEELGLPQRAATSLAQAGPAKILLAELEARFNRRAVDQLRGFGWKGPIATTNYWGKAPLYILPAMQVGDIVDTHSYGDAEFMRTSPFFEANFVTWLAAGQIAGMPMAVTEWAVPWPARDRFAAPLFLSGTAALQEWDAVAFYVYSQHPIPPPAKPTEWSSLQDPGVMAMLPTAALMFREQHVSAAKTTYRLELGREAVYGAPTSPRSSVAIRTLAEQSRLEIGLPDLPKLDWDTKRPGREGATVIEDPNVAFLPTDATSVTSDTGELKRDWASEIYTVDTAKTQAAQGWLGGATVVLGDVELRLKTPKAAVAVTALDNRPIRSSTRLLLTTVAQVSPSEGDRFPLLSQPVDGEVVIRSDAPALELVPLVEGAVAIPLEKAGDGFRFALPNPKTHWFEVRAPQ